MINSFQKNSIESPLLEDAITPWMGPLAPWTKEPIVDSDDRARNWFAICIGVSLLLHVLLLMIYLPQKKMGEEIPLNAGPIAVSLEPVKPSRSEPKQPDIKPEPPRQTIIASRKPPTSVKPIYVPPPPEKPQPVRPVEPTPPQPEESMETQIAKRRAQRQLQEDDAARENAEARGREGPSVDQRIADNINRAKKAATHEGTSGVFQVLNVGVREGSFKFNGWHPGAGDSWQRTYNVDAGEGGDVRLAIVKKEIEVIRESYKETDFTWDSRRLGHPVVKSARVADNAELEAFLLREMFDDPTEAPMARRR